jgi:hypothetical protein
VRWYWCPRRRPRYRRGLAHGGGGALRGRRWDFLKDFLVSGLQLGDLAHHLFLTGGELLDGFSHVGKMALDGLSHRGNIRLYLLYMPQVGRRSGGRRGQLNSSACGTRRRRRPSEVI